MSLKLLGEVWCESMFGTESVPTALDLRRLRLIAALS